MARRGKQKTRRQRQSVPGPWRRYGFWILAAALGVTLVVIGIVALPGDENRSTSSAPLSLAKIPRISPETVKTKMDFGVSITIVDARSKTEYEQGHIAGAVSIPLAETAQRYGELNRADEIVIYCT